MGKQTAKLTSGPGTTKLQTSILGAAPKPAAAKPVPAKPVDPVAGMLNALGSSGGVKPVKPPSGKPRAKQTPQTSRTAVEQMGILNAMNGAPAAPKRAKVNPQPLTDVLTGKAPVGTLFNPAQEQARRAGLSEIELTPGMMNAGQTETAKKRRTPGTVEHAMAEFDRAGEVPADVRELAKSYIFSRVNSGASTGKNKPVSGLVALKEFRAAERAGRLDEIAGKVDQYRRRRAAMEEAGSYTESEYQAFTREFNAGLGRALEQFEDNLGGNYAERVFADEKSHPAARALARLWSGAVTGVGETLQMPADLVGDAMIAGGMEGSSTEDRVGAGLNVLGKGLGIAGTAAGVGVGGKMVAAGGLKNIAKGLGRIAYELGPIQNPFKTPKALQSSAERMAGLVKAGKVNKAELESVGDMLGEQSAFKTPEAKKLIQTYAGQVMKAAKDAGAPITEREAVAAGRIAYGLHMTGKSVDGKKMLETLAFEGRKSLEEAVMDAEFPAAAQVAPKYEPSWMNLAEPEAAKVEATPDVATGPALWRNADADEIVFEGKPTPKPEPKTVVPEVVKKAGVEVRGVDVQGDKPTYARSGSKKYPVKWKLVELDDIHASHDDDKFIQNPDWKGAGQPRDRGRAEDRLQVDGMARNLDPEQHLEITPGLTQGSPVIDAFGNVEHGNGRTMSMKRARRMYPEQWAAYQKAIREQYPDAASMKDPVLVRERVDDGGLADERAMGEYLRQGSAPEGKGLSTTEVARADASRLREGFWDNLDAKDGNFIDALNSRSNDEIVTNFVKSLLESERAMMLDAKGQLSLEGYRRIERAALHSLLGEDGAATLERLLESGDDIGARIADGLRLALGRLLPVKTDRMSELVNDAITEYVKFKSSKFKGNFTEYVAQGRMDGFDQTAIDLVKRLHEASSKGGSSGKVADVFADLADTMKGEHAAKYQDPLFQQNKLFDDGAPVNKPKHSEADIAGAAKLVADGVKRGHYDSVASTLRAMGFSDGESRMIVLKAGGDPARLTKGSDEAIFGGLFGEEQGALFQKLQPTVTKGQYRWDKKQKKGIVTILKQSDISTVIHETAHHQLKYMPDAQFKAIARLAGVNSESFDDLTEKDYVNMQEFYARSVENALYKGQMQFGDKHADIAVLLLAKKLQEVYPEGVPKPERWNPKRKGGLNQEGEPRLKAYHNTSMAGLRHALDLGGVPSPSIAVTRAGNAGNAFDEFGEVTLVGRREIVDPQSDWRNNLYDRDVYSQRQPRPAYKLNKKQFDAIAKGIAKDLGQNGWTGYASYWVHNIAKLTDGNWGRFIDQLRSDDMALAAFMKAKHGQEFSTMAEGRRAFYDLKGDAKYDEFDQWADDAFLPMRGEPLVKTRNGWEPYTLQSVSNAMGGKVRAQETSMTQSLAKQAAKQAKRFDGVEDARKQSSRIDPEAFEAYKEAREGVEMALHKGLTLTPGKGFDELDAVSDIIGRLAKGSVTEAKVRSALSRFSPTDEAVTAGVELATMIKRTPAKYFEAKPTRPVEMSEFAGVVLPDNAPAELVAAAKAKGLEVVTYKRGDKESRRQAMSAFDERAGVLFQNPGKGGWEPPDEFYDLFAQMIHGSGKVNREVPNVKAGPKGEAPAEGQRFGISNAAMEASENVNAPKGKGRSAQEIIEGAEDVKTSHEAITLAEGIAKGDIPNTPENAAKALKAGALLETRVNQARQALAEADDMSRARALEEYEASLQDYQDFSDNIQVAKSQWSDYGRVLAAKVNEAGNYAGMTETLRGIKGKRLSVAEEDAVKRIADAHDAAVKEIADLKRQLAEAAVQPTVTPKVKTGAPKPKQVQEARKVLAKFRPSMAERVEGTTLNQLDRPALNQVEPEEVEDVFEAIKVLAREHVAAGKKGLDEVASAITAEFPKLSKDDVIDALAAPSNRTFSATAKEMAKLKEEAKRLRGIERNRPSLEKQKAALETRIAALKAKIASGDLSVQARKRNIELKDLEDERDALMKRINQMRNAEKAIPRIEARMAKLQERMATKNFETVPKDVQAKSLDVQRAEEKLRHTQREFNAMKAEMAMAQDSKSKKVVRFVGNATRLWQLGSDLGMVLRQGAWVAPSNPKQYLKALKSLTFREDSYKAVQTLLETKEIDGVLMAKVRRDAGLSMTDMTSRAEEGLELLAKTKKLGNKLGIGSAARAQTAYINVLRAEIFDAAYATGLYDKKDLKQIAALINTLTGRGNIKQVPDVLNMILTSVRFESSRWGTIRQVVGGSVSSLKPNKYKTGFERYRGKQFARLGTRVMIPLIVAKMYLERTEQGSVELDPMSTDFMKLRYGNTTVDLTAGVGIRARSLMRMVSGAWHGDWRYTSEEAKKRGFAAVNPGVGLAAKYNSGVSTTGMKVDEDELGATGAAPLSWQQAAKDYGQIMRGEGAPVMNVLETFLGLVGAGVQEYPKPKPNNPKRAKSKVRDAVQPHLLPSVRKAQGAVDSVWRMLPGAK